MIYFKQENTIPPDGRDEDPEKEKQLIKFKDKLRDSEHGHTVTEFSGPYELATRLSCDLHNWLFERYLAPALNEALSGTMSPDRAAKISGDLRQLAEMNRELLAKLAEEKRLMVEQRKLALEAFYKLTYIVPETLARFPKTDRIREQVVRDNLLKLQQLLKLSDDAHEVKRELATNYRLLATILMEQDNLSEAYEAFKNSAALYVSLVNIQPNKDLYHRDKAASYLNAGYIMERKGKPEAALKDYRDSLDSANRAAELNPRWLDLASDAKRRVERLKDS